MVNPRITRRERRNVLLFALLIITPLLILFPVIQVDARQEKSAELLYRSVDHLYIFNADNGKTTTLPNITSAMTIWYWSPNGQFLMNTFHMSETGEKSIHIYDVDQQNWVFDIPVDKTTYNAYWSSDSTQIAYDKVIMEGSDIKYTELWIIDLKTMARRKIYQTRYPAGNIVTDTEMWNIWWSPDDHYILMEEIYSTVATRLGGLTLISSDGKLSKRIDVLADSGITTPIWSPDSKWFLLNTRDPFRPPFDSNDAGDVLLYGIDDQIYNLSYTPQAQEYNERWSVDGKEIYFERDNQLFTTTLQEAINNPWAFVVKRGPLPPTVESKLGDYNYPSPDGRYVAYANFVTDGAVDLYIAQPHGSQSSQIASSVVFLGWRPS